MSLSCRTNPDEPGQIVTSLAGRPALGRERHGAQGDPRRLGRSYGREEGRHREGTMSRQDVENGEKTWLEAFNSGDAAGVAACYTKDARLLAPNTDIVKGRADMTQFLQGFLDTGAKLA